MKIRELINILNKYDPEYQVIIGENNQFIPISKVESFRYDEPNKDLEAATGADDCVFLF